MKKLFALPVILILIPAAFAIRGVGIKYSTEGATFIPGQESCMPYKVYNPWDEDVTITLDATGELKKLFARSGQADVPAGTSSQKAVELEICFDIPKVSKSKCSTTKYHGQVVAKEAANTAVGGTGSATSVVASAPLTISMNCDEEVTGASIFDGFEFGLTAIFFLVTIFVASFALIFLIRKYNRNPEVRRKKYMDMYHQITELQEQLRYEPFDQEKQQRYSTLWEKMQKMRKDL